MKYIIILILLLLSGHIVWGEEAPGPNSIEIYKLERFKGTLIGDNIGQYTYLESSLSPFLEGREDEAYDLTDAKRVGVFNLSFIYNLSIGIGALLAVFMLMLVGLRYTYSGVEGASAVTHSNKRLREIGLGLVILLTAYAFINIINPSIHDSFDRIFKSEKSLETTNI